MIKFFMTKSRNRARVSQRRKSNGSILVAHLLDIAFARYDLNLVLTCSQKGRAEAFWASCGFEKPTKGILKNISRIPLHELNPFSDTVLMVITRKGFCEKYLSKDPSAMAGVFRRWSRKHRKSTWNATFKLHGQTVRKLVDLPKY